MRSRLIKFRAWFAWLWRIGVIRRTTALKWEVDVLCLDPTYVATVLEIGEDGVVTGG